MYPSGDMEGEFLAAPLASPVEAMAWLSEEALLKLLEGTDASDAGAEGSAVLAWPGPPNIYNHNKHPTTCPSQNNSFNSYCWVAIPCNLKHQQK